MKKPQEPEIDIDEEYGRIAENEMIYLDEIARWKKLKRILPFIMLISLVTLLASFLSLPTNTPIDWGSFQYYPLQVALVWITIPLYVLSFILATRVSRKTSKVESEIGLHEEEKLYLHAYETNRNIVSYLNESSPKRKLYLEISIRECSRID